jgi:protocatechuate 3,4-dioxygenase beta subunit
MRLRRVAFPSIVLSCTGLILFLLLADSRVRAADPPAAKVRPRRARPPRLPNSLTGQITGELGTPVADARVEMFPKPGGVLYKATTKADGTYVFERVPAAAVYHLRILSERCVSRFDYRDDQLDIALDPTRTVTRDFVLKPACQLHVTVVDEEGNPVPRVTVYPPGVYAGQYPQTDAQGKAVVGGLAPSSEVRGFGLRHEDFAIESLQVKLSEPKTIVERNVTLTRGKAVRGSVTCSDGKPAFGCTVSALPDWWDFPAFPRGQRIDADGSFVFPHVGPGAYKITVTVPEGDDRLISFPVMSDANLSARKEPLALKIDVPAPASMTFIEGWVQFRGGVPKKGFYIRALGATSALLGHDQYIRPGTKKFKIGPMPAGRYHLKIESPEIEAKEVASIEAGTKNLILDLTVRTLTLKGIVGGDDATPLKDLRIRIFKTKSLRGSNFEADRGWHPITDPKGAFSIDIPGPGVYAVEASAEGYALGRSEPANSATDLNKPIRINLSKGVSVTGSVVDEEGHPIDGATVLVRSIFGDALPVSAARLVSRASAVTSKGQFRLDHLNPGRETLRILHPQYLFAEIKDLEIKAGGQQPPIVLTMKRGGTVRGRVFDAAGRPLAGVSLHCLNGEFDDHQGTNEFSRGVSDEAGDFELAHLPERMVYISRTDEWTSLGVVRQAVLLSVDKPVRLDFGGVKKVTGRLLVNGKPLANTKVLLGDDTSDRGIFKSLAMTDGDGNFVFRGIPLGERTLYFSAGESRRQHWARVKPLRIETSNDAFGNIELVTGTLVVHAPEIPFGSFDGTNITLNYYDPTRLNIHFAGFSVLRKKQGDPFIYRDLPRGRYSLQLTRAGKLEVREIVEITGPEEKSVTIVLPKGTASVEGTFKRDATDRPIYLQLQSQDKRLSGELSFGPDGRFQLAGLPGGEYQITQILLPDAEPLAAFPIADGETKLIAISLPVSTAAKGSRSYLRVIPFTADGLPLPGCAVSLIGAKGDVPPRGSQSGQISFATEPGSYRLSVNYPGFDPVSQHVDVKPSGQPERPGREPELNVILVRSTQQTSATTR